MKFMLKTLGISLVLAIAGCASTSSTTSPSLSAADDAPACSSSCSTACKSKCSSAKSDSCCGKCDGKKASSNDAKSSLGAFDDEAKTSCCPNAKKAKSSGECPFSGKQQ